MANSEITSGARKYLKEFYVKDYIYITIGLILYSIGVVGFIVPAKFVTGGAIGISLMVQYATGLPVQYVNLVINLILLAVAYKILGSRFLIKTVFGVLMMTLVLSLVELVLPKSGLLEGEALMGGVIGGMLMGTGVGIVLSSGGSTGGLDIVVASINKYKDISFGRLMLIFDCCIISSSAFFLNYDLKIIVSSIIVLTVMVYLIDLVINGYRQTLQLMIFSSEYEKIADTITYEMNRGCTVLDGKGWYTKSDVKILIIVCKRSEVDDFYRLIHNIDQNAFITEQSTVNVYGEGFNDLKISRKKEKAKTNS